jgi:HTH-type transcriptional regulator/antitoxin HigA
MEQLGLKQSDLAKYLGGRSRASEVLNRKRKLTVDMIRSLRKHLDIPAESLLA